MRFYNESDNIRLDTSIWDLLIYIDLDTDFSYCITRNVNDNPISLWFVIDEEKLLR